MLLSMNIVHYDLKGNNIMFNEINKLPLILDFGLSIKMDELKADNLEKFFYIYAPEYTPWCLEIHYLSNCPTFVKTGYILCKVLLRCLSILMNFKQSFVVLCLLFNF